MTRGHTFLAQAIAVQRIPETSTRGASEWTLFQVAAVYGGNPPQPWRIATSGCHLPGPFRPGTSYVISTSRLADPDAETLAAWELDGEQLRLVVFEGTEEVYAAPLLAATTLDEVIALMVGVPTATPESAMTPTTTPRVGNHAAEAPPLADFSVMLLMAAVTGLVLVGASVFLYGRRPRH